MMTDTNGQRHTSPRSRTRSTKRAAMIYGLNGAVFALLFVITLPNVTTWYLNLATCALAVAAILNIVKTITTLRQDDHIPAQ